MLVAVEGPDGVGKSSVAKAVATNLGFMFREFPDRRTYTGSYIDSYLKREWAARGKNELANDRLSALCFQALNLANRLEAWHQLAHACSGAALNAWQRNLVLGRYNHSGWVYGQLDGLDDTWLTQVLGVFPQPQLHILLDAPPELCVIRRQRRDGALPAERYEQKVEQTKQVHKLYRQLWELEPWPGRWVQVDATKPFDEVLFTVEQLIKDFR